MIAASGLRGFILRWCSSADPHLPKRATPGRERLAGLIANDGLRLSQARLEVGAVSWRLCGPERCSDPASSSDRDRQFDVAGRHPPASAALCC